MSAKYQSPADRAAAHARFVAHFAARDAERAAELRAAADALAAERDALFEQTKSFAALATRDLSAKQRALRRAATDAAIAAHDAEMSAMTTPTARCDPIQP